MSDILSLKDNRNLIIQEMSTKASQASVDSLATTLASIKAKTDTITNDLFTSTHASRIDTNISSRADQSTADAIKAKTDLITATGMGGGIKSVQRGSIIMKFNEGSKSVAISSVNLNKSFLILSNTSYLYSSTSYVFDVSGQISSATSLLFTRKSTQSSTNDGNYTDWQVIEFY